MFQYCIFPQYETDHPDYFVRYPTPGQPAAVMDERYFVAAVREGLVKYVVTEKGESVPHFKGLEPAKYDFVTHVGSYDIYRWKGQ